jgi:hypothetical protein
MRPNEKKKKLRALGTESSLKKAKSFFLKDFST